MRSGSHLFGCSVGALLLSLCLSSTARAAERKAAAEAFIELLPAIIGGIIAIILVGGVVVWLISLRPDRNAGQTPLTPQTPLKPLYKSVIEPGIILIVFCVGMYIAYPFIAEALGEDPNADAGRRIPTSIHDPAPTINLPPPTKQSPMTPRQ